MANYATLKGAVQSVITNNGNNEITGLLLQQALLAMINSLGADYQFVGVATPSTNPGTPDENVVYIAGPGTYPNFNSLQIQDGNIGIFRYDGLWDLQTIAVGSDYSEEIEELRIFIEERTGKFSRQSNFTSESPFELISNLYIPAGTKIKILISSNNASWNRLALYGNNTDWSSRNWTIDNIQKNVEKEFVATVDITKILVYPIDVITFGTLNIQILFEPEIIAGKFDTDNVKQVLGFNEEFVISQKCATKNIYTILSSLIPRDLGKNKFVPTFLTVGKAILEGGIVENVSGFSIAEFVPVLPSTAYYFSAVSDIYGDIEPTTTSTYYKFFDENFNELSVLSGRRGFTTPANAKYASFTVISDYDKFQLEIGNSFTEYENVIYLNTEYQNLLRLVQAGPLDFSIALKKLDFVISKNLINENDSEFATGYYLRNANGDLDEGSNYNTTGFCKVAPNGKYMFSDGNTNTAFNARFVLFYNAEREPLTSTYASNQTSPITAPNNAYFVRISYLSTNTKPQLEAGEIVTGYEPFKLVIPQTVIEQKPKENPITFDSFRDSGTIGYNGVLSLPQVHIQKNVLLSAKIVGTISTINFGVGYLSGDKDYNSRWLELTSSEIKVYSKYGGDAVLNRTYQHGLTLNNETFVTIASILNEYGMTTEILVITGAGDRFRTTFGSPEWGVGCAFVENLGNSNLAVELSLMLRDITKKIWVFGDSYLAFGNDARWGYYAVEDNLLQFLANNQPGITPSDSVVDLRNLLSLGYVPVYLVWMLGMNGDGVEQQVGGQYVINDYQKANIDAVIGICMEHGIIPIFSCVPTVPQYQKTGFCNYIRSLNYRYIDIANAVGTNQNGQWTSGLLSSDNVHPTDKGAIVIYGEILKSVPEISIQN